MTETRTLTADDIPVAHTPKGGWKGEMPPPVLDGSAEPRAPGAPDLRGLWQAVLVEQDGQVLRDHRLNRHVERVEQCGNRVVVTSEGVIHDMRADGTLENGVNDVAAANSGQEILVAALSSTLATSTCIRSGSTPSALRWSRARSSISI